jgi:hypothetical protein
MTNNGATRSNHCRKFNLERHHPFFEARTICCGKLGIANIVSALDECRGQEELPMLRGAVILEAMQDEEAHRSALRSADTARRSDTVATANAAVANCARRLCRAVATA